MRLRPLRAHGKRVWRPSWEIHGSSSLALVLSSLIGASDDANGELASARVALERSVVSPRVRRRDANSTPRPSEYSAGSLSCHADVSAVISLALCHAADASGSIGANQCGTHAVP